MLALQMRRPREVEKDSRTMRMVALIAGLYIIPVWVNLNSQISM